MHLSEARAPGRFRWVYALKAYFGGHKLIGSQPHVREPIVVGGGGGGGVGGRGFSLFRI